MLKTSKIIVYLIFAVSFIDLSINVEVIPDYYYYGNHHNHVDNQTQTPSTSSLKFVRVKRCRPGGYDCRLYRVAATCPPEICGNPDQPIRSQPLQSDSSIVHETYVSPPITYVSSSSSNPLRTEYSYSSSSSASSSSSSSSSSSRIIQSSSSPITYRSIPPSPSKIIEKRIEKYRAPPPPPPVVQQKIVQEPITQEPIVVQQKYEQLKAPPPRPAPIVQQRIVQEPIVVQQKFERIQQVKQAPVVQQRIVQEPIVVQQKFEQIKAPPPRPAPVVQQRIVQEPIVVQQKFERIQQVKQAPIVEQKFERIKSTPAVVVQQQFERIVQKPIVSMRITACPEGHFLSEDGTHCKHIDCDSGFEFDAKLFKCVDIDECSVPTACLKNEQCINTYGSYVCRKICTQAGYRLNELYNTCEDIDECQEQLHQCGSQQTCLNTIGSYQCQCPTGYRLDGQHCVDIDECAESHEHLCPHDVSTCENTAGSYYCKCKRGFEKDHNGRCQDFDECTLNNGGCSQRCVNKYGSYECHCNDGFKLSSDGHTCVDIDECVEYAQTGICSPQVSICENTIGSYRCRCRTGFRDPDGVGKHCVDIDECLEQTNLCEQKCINTFGSYKCQCNRGYRPVGPHRCEDIDECYEGDIINDVSFSRFRHNEQDGHPKLCQGNCVNSAGSYQCTCPNGYNLVHNHHCIDIDECKEYGYCRGTNQSCVNIGGSFRCVDDRCPPGYHKDGIQCKVSERLNYAELCDDPTEVCSIDRVICYSYAYIAFRSRMIKQQQRHQEQYVQRIVARPVKGDRKSDGHSYQSVVEIQRLRQQQQQQHSSTSSNSIGDNLPKSHEFFTFVVPVEPPIIVDFKLRMVSVKSPRPNVRPANVNDFEMRRTKDNEVRLALVSSLQGPQDIELEIEAKMFKNGLQIGKNIAIVMIFISEYEF